MSEKEENLISGKVFSCKSPPGVLSAVSALLVQGLARIRSIAESIGGPQIRDRIRGLITAS